MKQQKFEGCYVEKVINISRTGTGRPKKPPAQSKGQPKQVRFYPEMEDAIKELCWHEQISFTEFIERCVDVGLKHYDHLDLLVKLPPDCFALIKTLAKKI